MNSKLYVGNLSYSTGEEQLREAFSEFGQLRAVTIVTDRMTGQPRGFGFVEFETDEQAQQAIQNLDGTQLDGRSITVNVAREREPRRFDGPSGGGGGGGGGGRGGRPRSDGNKSRRGSGRW